MFDIADIITNHQRALGRRETEEGEAYVLRLGRHYDAPVEDVWDACTDPERIARWFLPVSGDFRLGVYAEGDDCVDPGGEGAAYALVLDGDLEGCHYTFVETAVSSPSGTYRETGTELFVASDGSSTFETTYRFEAKYEDPTDPATEIFGRCQHPIVKGSGTGDFEGVSGRLDFKDDIEAGNFPYRGHLRW